KSPKLRSIVASSRSFRGGHNDGLGILAPALNGDLSIGPYCSSHHAVGVEGGGHVALLIERDHAAISMLLHKLFHHHLIRRLVQSDMQVAHPLADVRRHDIAHEKFACPGSRDCTAYFVGVGSRTENRRVSYAPRHFHYSSARGSAGGEIASLVQRHHPNRTVLFTCRKSRRFVFLFGRFGILIALPFAFIEKKIRRNQFD